MCWAKFKLFSQERWVNIGILGQQLLTSSLLHNCNGRWNLLSPDTELRDSLFCFFFTEPRPFSFIIYVAGVSDCVTNAITAGKFLTQEASLPFLSKSIIWPFPFYILNIYSMSQDDNPVHAYTPGCPQHRKCHSGLPWRRQGLVGWAKTSVPIQLVQKQLPLSPRHFPVWIM